MDKNEMNNLKLLSRDIRKDVIRMAFQAKSSHVGAALSIVDILIILYYKILNISPDNINDIKRDKFILSKGHASSALYAVLAERGFFDKELLNTYDMNGSNLIGHPKKDTLPGIEASTGSLGHGIGIACGIALSDKNDGRNSRTITLMGDGECDEGSIWETAMFASSKKLNNLIVIIDNNSLQGLGRVNEVTGLYPLNEKWRAFNWDVIEINGHNYEDIYYSLKKAYMEKDKPTAIIAHTTKGKGVSFMEDKLEWHYKSPNKEEYENAIKELV